MKPINVFEFNGNYFENGRLLGKELGKSDHFKSMLRLIKGMATFKQEPAEVKKMLAIFCPQLLEELQGIQAGLKLTERETLQLFSGYDTPQLKELGCTSFMNKDFYVRNYDFSPDIYDNAFIMQKQSDESWICGNAQFVLGRLDGMNHNGLVVGLHFVNNQSYTKGFLCSTIVRIVLEICSNVDEAIELLKEIPHAASYNYSLLDANGDFAVFEATPNLNNVHQMAGSLVCVNMFQTKEMEPYNREQITSSKERINKLASLSNKTNRVDDIHEFFSDRSSPVFFTDYDQYFGTLYTVSYIPKSYGVLLTTGDGVEIPITSETLSKK